MYNLHTELEIIKSVISREQNSPN